MAQSDPRLRSAAGEASLMIGGSESVESVLVLLNDSDRDVRWNVCGLLHDFGDGRACEPLTSILQNDPDAEIRLIAAWALEEVGDETALPALQQAVDSDTGTDREGRYIRDAAAEAITAILGRKKNPAGPV